MSGWVVAVLVEEAGEPAAVRQYFAVGHPDRGKAEWTAVDQALGLGAVASSPQNGQEPVQTVSPLPPAMMAKLGLRPGEVRALGAQWPRRWILASAVIARR